MNITKVLEQVHMLKNGYDIKDEQLIGYISLLENRILKDIVSGREGEAWVKTEYSGYEMSTNREHELFAPEGFEDIYAHFCCAQIDLLFEDSDRYINDSVVFRDTYKELKRFWWKTHRQVKDYRYHK